VAHVEADLQRYCRVDLRDLWRPGGGASRLTYRRLAVLIDHALPGESATKTAMRDALGDEVLAKLSKVPSEGHGRWSHAELLLARVIDLLGVVASGMQLKEAPPPYPRPGVAAQKRRALSPEGHAYLMKIRREHERLHGYSTDGATEAG
jgi:hypothetical protein